MCSLTKAGKDKWGYHGQVPLLVFEPVDDRRGEARHVGEPHVFSADLRPVALFIMALLNYSVDTNVNAEHMHPMHIYS